MKKPIFYSLLLGVSFLINAQGSPLADFEPFLGHIWKASGVWGDGSLFQQETTFEFHLQDNILIAKSKGYTNSEQSEYGNRNFGIRKFNPTSEVIEFWEFDVFGGVTKGTVTIDEKRIIYSYDYDGYPLADIWAYVNDSTYNFTVASFENGKIGNSFLETQFRKVKTAPLTYSNKKIEASQIVDCSLKDAWAKWTTQDGLKSFFGQNNKVEIKPGGAYEIYIDDSQPYGKKGGEGSKVLSFIPNQMLSFTWNAPPSIPSVRTHDHKSWIVITFEELPSNQTKVSLTHLGFLEGDDWDATYDYFKGAWPYVLGAMAKSCK